MAELFSEDWMQAFGNAWNDNGDITGPLSEAGFNSVIGYGYPDDDTATGVIVVENGVATAAGSYGGEDLDWDIRASRAQWDKWLSKPPGMAGLGMAFTTGKLKFKVGDYKGMMKNPALAGPFVKSFGTMANVA